MNTDEFTAPRTLDEAEVRRQDLTLNVQSIQAQLGDKQRTDDNGRRLTSKEYWAWKKRATHALNQKLDELRLVKQWLRNNRQPSTSIQGAVAHLINILEALGRDEPELKLTEDVTHSIEAAEDYLQRLDASTTARRDPHDQTSKTTSPSRHRQSDAEAAGRAPSPSPARRQQHE
ncbi:MAG: hypothetical protein JRE57_00050 [Deltaproteobacteria bacterium]|nr:hypothetical protein [Deltaproteobacteria bacterium]